MEITGTVHSRVTTVEAIITATAYSSVPGMEVFSTCVPTVVVTITGPVYSSVSTVEMAAFTGTMDNIVPAVQMVFISTGYTSVPRVKVVITGTLYSSVPTMEWLLLALYTLVFQ